MTLSVALTAKHFEIQEGELFTDSFFVSFYYLSFNMLFWQVVLNSSFGVMLCISKVNKSKVIPMSEISYAQCNSLFFFFKGKKI